MSLRSLFIAFVLFLLTACQQGQENLLQGEIQGTTYHIKMVLEPRHPDVKTLDAAIRTVFSKVDEHMSNWRDDSEISLLNNNPSTGKIPLSPELHGLLLKARDVYNRSNGCYDLTVKPLVDVWGFARHENRVPSDQEIARILPNIGMKLLQIDDASPALTKLNPAVKIDLSSIAQGYTVGEVATVLEGFGISNYLAEIGGEMKVKGHKADGSAWRVAIEKPTPFKREIQRVKEIHEQNGVAVMASGTYRNFFESGGQVYSHIIDPKTGRPVSHHLLATTVLHDNPTLADAWSTALLCLGEVEGKAIAEKENIRALFIYHEGNELKEVMSSAFGREP